MKRKRAASEQAREHTNEESRSKSSRLDASIVGKALDNGDASDEEEYGGENGAFLENGDTGDSFEHQYSDALADIMDPLVSRAQEGKADTDVSISETFGTLARRHFGRSVSSVFRVGIFTQLRFYRGLTIGGTGQEKDCGSMGGQTFKAQGTKALSR